MVKLPASVSKRMLKDLAHAQEALPPGPSIARYYIEAARDGLLSVVVVDVDVEPVAVGDDR